MIRNRLGALVFTLSLAFVASTLAANEAEANPYKGKIQFSAKRFPLAAKSKKAYFAQIKKQSSTKFQEDKENKEWKIHFAAFFRQPLNDLEVTVRIYDVTTKQKNLKIAFEQYLNGRGQKEIISNIKLDRDKFGVNRRLVMEIVSRNKVLAKGTFQILGEGEKFSGKVDFSEEETQSNAP